MADMSTCIICGKQYKTCLSCQQEISLKPWRTITDEINCYKIFLVLSQYNNGYIKKDEAKKQLEKIRYNETELREPVRETIKEIMSTSETKKNTSKTEE